MAEKRQERQDRTEKIEERNIIWLSEISKKDIPIAGGKGANLAEMFNLGMPVPPAFVVSAFAFAKFLKETGLNNKIYSIIKTIDMENTEQLEKTAKEIQNMVVESKMPEDIQADIEEAYDNLNVDKNMLEKASYDAMKILNLSREPCFVAVRSSATTEDLANASFAGQQETFLNRKGNKQLLEAVKKCWASLFTARAIYYRERNNFEQEKSLIAVIVQKMINSDKSGVIFTINPINNNREEIIVEAVFGLGEGIVSGAVEPDTYVVNKKDYKLISKKIGKKNIYFTKNAQGETIRPNMPKDKVMEQVLEWPELEKLIYHAKKLEEHYKWPQDIEFAIEGNSIYIVQTRPVTTIKKEKEKAEEKVEGQVIVQGFAASPGIATGKVKVILSLDELFKIQKGDILVTKMTNPDMVVTMQKSAAIVTDEGGLTAHAAIVSREIGLPCVVGTRNATSILKDGMIVTVDGTHGKVYSGGNVSIQEQEEEKEQIIEREKGRTELVVESGEQKNVIAFIGDELKRAWDEVKKVEHKVENKVIHGKHHILVKVNCDLPDMAEKAAQTGAEGVGLVRIEFIIAQGGVHPAEYIRQNQQDEYSRLLAQGLEKIAKAFQGKPVWVRTSDIRTDEYRSLRGSQQEPHEANPMLGWHGIRRALDEPEILKAELKAIKILHDNGYKNVGIMFPFLIYTNELKKAKEFMVEVGLNPLSVDYGVMIETPAAASIIDELCREGIKFISFGTNDLTQLTLGIDRNNENIAPLYDEMHPSIMKQITHVINVCKSHNVKTSICGQAGSREEMAQFLASKGIDSISANIDAVSKIKAITVKYE